MSRGETKYDQLPGAQNPPESKPFWRPSIPPRLLMGQLAALLLLALVTTWLLHRNDGRQDTVQMENHARWTAELVSRAAGSETVKQDSPHLLPLLEQATRDANLRAAAILDSTGVIVAHTDLARTGLRFTLPPDGLGGDDDQIRALSMRLFGNQSGQLLAHPIAGPQGRTGTLVFLLPAPKGGLFAFAPEAFLPIALLLLAYVGLTQSTVRRALAPTSVFLEKLSKSIQTPADLAEDNPSNVVYSEVMDKTVTFVDTLRQARESLTIENRVLSYERKRMEKILDQLPDGIIIVDHSEKISFLNRAAIGMLDLKTDDQASHQASSIPDTVRSLLQEAKQDGRATLTKSDDANTRTVTINRISMQATGGRTAGTIYTLRDATAQQSAERAQAEFLSQVTHELKAPLNTIVTYVEALADDGLLTAEERKEFYNTLSAEAHRMGQLISNLLQLSRIEMGNLSARFGFVKIGDLVRATASAVRAQAEGCGLDFDISVPENLPSIQGDKDLLGVAVTNLVTNAIKYTPEGGTVSVRALEADGGVAIEVQDTGFGIPEEIHQSIFMQFVRSEQEEVQAKSGSGLGLSLVKEIADTHEGTIAVESAEGSGSTFRLWLPTREIGSQLSVPAA